MGLFSRSGKKSGKSSKAVFRDPFLYDAEFQSAHRKLVEGSWTEAQSDIDRRSDGWLLLLALTGAESAVGVETFKRWADTEPSGTSFGLLGAAQTRDAWAIRGNQTADKVTSGSWKPFKDGLRDAEAGGAAHSVLPAAHFEYALYEDDLIPSSYFARPEVSNEMKGAARVFLGATPEDPGPAHLMTLNYYCYLLIPTDAESARLVEECYRRLGDKATGNPWTYFNDTPGERYVKIRNLRLSEARSF